MAQFKYGDDAYFDHPAYSQSDLKTVLDCPQLLWEMKHNGGGANCLQQQCRAELSLTWPF